MSRRTELRWAMIGVSIIGGVGWGYNTCRTLDMYVWNYYGVSGNEMYVCMVHGCNYMYQDVTISRGGGGGGSTPM